MKIVAFATIKLNSERVPHKNTQPIGSKPLCYHIVNTALQVEEIDDVYVYCSDEAVINYIPEKANFLQREKWLDGNEIRAKDTYTAFVNDVDADIYIAMCTTSPFTKKETLENALHKVLYEGYDSAFTAKKMQTFAWYQGKPINYDISNVPRTQDMEPVYVETSAFFIFTKELWVNHGRRIGFHPYIQEVGEIESVDIDTMEDLQFAQVLADNVLRV
ncbi:MAG: acylneuraminate cytidylyltransferase family protein [Lachnospiraceae bacterium]|nr:acylneuraminate cytidylyltransferase family protein [Lachnospiraceae bacterium]